MKKIIIVLATCLAGSVALAAPAVIHVDQNAAPGGDGGSWATAFQTILDGADALALSNAVETGGHTILVAEGVYTNMVVFENVHTGDPAAYNEMKAVGNVVVDVAGNETYCVQLNKAYNFAVRGFKMTGATAGGLYLDNGNLNWDPENWLLDDCWMYGNGAGVSSYRHSINATIFTNCAIFNNTGYGLFLQGSSEFTFINCLFTGNGREPIFLMYSGHDVRLTNCVVAGNGSVGLGEIYIYCGEISADNCLLYGNASANFYDRYEGWLVSADEINALPNCADNIVACPGFAGMINNDPTLVYEGSPLLGAGAGGGNIGLDNYTTVPVSSNIYYVNAGSGNDLNTGTSPGAAWATIQRAAGSMIAGDTVNIASGTYVENLVITNTGVEGKPVRFLAEPGAILDGGGNAYGLVLEHAANVEFAGLEIISSASAAIAPIKSYGCVISNAIVRGGGTYGVLVSEGRVNGNIEYVDCDIHGHAHNVILYSAGQMFRNCNIYNATGYGVYCRYQYNSPSRLENCNIYANNSGGIFLSTYSSLFFESCNIVNNTGHGVWTPHGGTHRFINCNITGNGNYGVYEAAAVTLHYCNLYANTNGLLYNAGTATGYTDIYDVNNVATPLDNYTNNISVNPMFKDPAAGNFSLLGASPCIDAGTSTTELETDYYGSPRLVGPAVDIGIFEAPPPGLVINFW